MVDSLTFMEKLSKMKKALGRTNRLESNCEQSFKLLFRMIKVLITFSQQSCMYTRPSLVLSS